MIRLSLLGSGPPHNLVTPSEVAALVPHRAPCHTEPRFLPSSLHPTQDHIMDRVRFAIWAGIIAAGFRGLFVFDMGGSAASTYPTASAICFVGALIAAVLMARAPRP